MADQMRRRYGLVANKRTSTSIVAGEPPSSAM
jgi:hypothetical protein